MHVAIKKGNMEIIKLLLQRPDLNINMKSILHNNFLK